MEVSEDLKFLKGWRGNEKLQYRFDIANQYMFDSIARGGKKGEDIVDRMVESPNAG